MKYSVIIIFLLIFFNRINAQEIAQETTQEIQPRFISKYVSSGLLPLERPMIQFAEENFKDFVEPNFTLKFSILSLLNPSIPMIQFAGESFIKSNLSLQYEIGVFSVDIIKPNRNTYDFGGRLKTEIRTYKNLTNRSFEYRYFWGVGLEIQQLIGTEMVTFCAPGSGCTLLITQALKKSTSVINPYMTIGIQLPIIENVMVEFSGNVGLTHKERYFLTSPIVNAEIYRPNRSTGYWLNGAIHICYSF